jgi:uncharacterized membrane protein YeaQ/YmgE (transglycosylase-associated protein family)
MTNLSLAMTARGCLNTLQLENHNNPNTTKTMGIITWILLGLVAGALAKFIMPGKDPGGILVTILIGIVGGVIGGFLGSFIGLGKIESFDLGGIIIATAGAILLLVIYRVVRKNKSETAKKG